MGFEIIFAYSLTVVMAILSFLVMKIYQKKILCLSAVLGAVERPLLFYDDRDVLQVATPGLVFFNRDSSRQIARPPAKPVGTGELVGEMIIDSNRYRYRSKLLEYKPGSSGTIVYLEYLGSVAAR